MIAAHSRARCLADHVADQHDLRGTTGQLGEGPVESVHVRDNELKRRNHNIRNAEDNLSARAKQHVMMTCPALKNIRTLEHRRAYARRQVQNFKSRNKRGAGSEALIEA